MSSFLDPEKKGYFFQLFQKFLSVCVTHKQHPVYTVFFLFPPSSMWEKKRSCLNGFSPNRCLLLLLLLLLFLLLLRSIPSSQALIMYHSFFHHAPRPVFTCVGGGRGEGGGAGAGGGGERRGVRRRRRRRRICVKNNVASFHTKRVSNCVEGGRRDREKKSESLFLLFHHIHFRRK